MTGTHISTKNMYIFCFFFFIILPFTVSDYKPIILSMVYMALYHHIHIASSKTAYISLWNIFFLFVWNFSNIINKNILFGHQSACHLCIRCVLICSSRYAICILAHHQHKFVMFCHYGTEWQNIGLFAFGIFSEI